MGRVHDLVAEQWKRVGPEELHRALGEFHRLQLTPTSDEGDLRADLDHEMRMRLVEAEFVASERAAVRPLLGTVPTEASAFVAWFEALEQRGPGQHDPLFDWLAEHASLAQMRYFLQQEVGGEAGFEDLVAMVQVKMPTRPKLELARNYWDEMGQGRERGMHGPLLASLAAALGVDDTSTRGVAWEPLALGNLMVALASRRRFAYQALGALGAIELTAPGRAAKVNDGLRRLGFDGDVRRYFALHATLDVKHSAAWNHEVLAPLVAADPSLALPIAEGAVLRLSAGARCFERYKTDLGLTFDGAGTRRHSRA